MGVNNIENSRRNTKNLKCGLHSTANDWNTMVSNARDNFPAMRNHQIPLAGVPTLATHPPKSSSAAANNFCMAATRSSGDTLSSTHFPISGPNIELIHNAFSG
jgi:hypothetical protein